MSQGRFRPSEHKALQAVTEPDTRYEVTAGDVLLTRANTPELVGDACFVKSCPPRLMLSDLIYRIRFGPAMSGRFAVYLALSRIGRFQIEADARGSSQSMVKVSQYHIRSWLGLVPPISEQEQISNFLDDALAKVHLAIEKTTASIALLREYRQSLITAAVTGKIPLSQMAAATEPAP